MSSSWDKLVATLEAGRPFSARIDKLVRVKFPWIVDVFYVNAAEQPTPTAPPTMSTAGRPWTGAVNAVTWPLTCDVGYELFHGYCSDMSFHVVDTVTIPRPDVEADAPAPSAETRGCTWRRPCVLASEAEAATAAESATPRSDNPTVTVEWRVERGSVTLGEPEYAWFFWGLTASADGSLARRVYDAKKRYESERERLLDEAFRRPRLA